MRDKNAPRTRREALLAELEGIRDIYRLDVRQFVGFVRERKLRIVNGFRKFAVWLDEEHEGKRYSPATINRKLTAARDRVRHAFKHSAFAADLRKKHQLGVVLKSAKLKKIDVVAMPSDKVLDIEEARALAEGAKDTTTRLMVSFLVRTGVRVSEMLGLKLTDLGTARDKLVPIRVKERIIHVKDDFVARLHRHFHGKTWLFEHNGRPYSRVSVTNRIKRESLRTLGREVSPQQLRNTWAAVQIKRGRSIDAVAALLGHSNPGLTGLKYPETAGNAQENVADDADDPPSEAGPRLRR